MPAKEWRLLLRDVSFFVSGRADVRSADWRANEWLYPADWSYQLDREDQYFAPKDSSGIPLREFPKPIGVRYLPSRIAAYALAHWNRWTIGKHPTNRAEFLRAANWMLHSPREGRYEHDIAVAGIAPPWISCIAQGEAASVLTRAYVLTSDSRYLRAADDAARWLMISEEDGGLLSRLPDGDLFLEEYPGSRYRHVLNGCLYGAVGLSDLSRVNRANNNIRLFLRKLCLSIGSHLSLWDISGWSTYDYPSNRTERRNLNTMTYHVLQIILLEYLAEVTGDESMRAMSERWSQSSRSMRARIGALMAKTRYRMAVRW